MKNRPVLAVALLAAATAAVTADKGRGRYCPTRWVRS